MLERAGAYAMNYRKVCSNLVALEKMYQKEFDRKGKLKNQRHFISDYFFISLPADPSIVVEVRETHTIDGRSLSPRKRGLLELFEKKSANVAEEAERVVRESTKHNLGRKRYTNMINFGLNFLLPENQDRIQYELLPPAEGSSGNVAILRFKEVTEKTSLRAVTPEGKFPIPSHGQIWLSVPESRVLKIDFSFRQENQTYSIAGRYLSEYQTGPDGLLVPGRFEEYLYDIEQPEMADWESEKLPYGKVFSEKEIQRLVFESEATYSNFRKFSSDVKFGPADFNLLDDKKSPH